MLALVLMACNVFAQDAAFKKEVENTIELTNLKATLSEAMRIQYQQLVDAGTIKLDDVQATADECAEAMLPKMKEFINHQRHHKTLSGSRNPRQTARRAFEAH